MSFIQGRGLSLSTIRQQIVGINKKVPIKSGQRVRYVNLDNAASTPTLKPVLDRIIDFLPWYSGVHRGSGQKSLVSTATYDAARIRIAQFFGADPNYHVVIFGKNTTEAINLLAGRLQFSPGDVVLSTLMEHHSNDLPWRRVARVIRADVHSDGSLNRKDLERKLSLYHRQIKLVALSGASNVTGWINDIYGIAALAHSYNIPIVVDGAQLAPHRRIQLLCSTDACHIDFLAISGHKLYAPFGAGALVGPRHLFDQGAPEFVGGGTVSLVTPLGVEWAAPPAKDEAGSPNVIGAVALASALTILDRLGLDSIALHEQALTDYALERLSQVPGLKLYGSTQTQDSSRLGVISFELEGYHHTLVAALLAFHGGIGVRSGCFCAQPYVQRLLGLDETAVVRLQLDRLSGKAKHLPGLVRISFGMYNTYDEIDRLVDTLQDIGSRSSDYWLRRLIWDDALGTYVPRDWRSPLPKEFAF